MVATIRDVAKRAGVSHTTVSNVLNNVPKVSEETRQRVLQVMKELNFEPNMVAKSLYTKRSFAMGYLVPTIANQFFMDIARGIEQVLFREDTCLFLCDTMFEVNRETNYLRRLVRQRVDGIIFSYTTHRKIVSEAVRTGIPVVAIESPADMPEISLIEVDNAAAAMKAVEHLADLGHRQIGVISLDFEGDVNKERLRGFQNGLKVNDLPLRSEFLLSLSSLKIGAAFFEQLADLDQKPLAIQERFTQEVKKLLALPHPPTAIICFDYQSAHLLTHYMASNGQIPGKDLSVVGFDIPSSLCIPRITTIRQPATEMGALAAELLLERINNPGIPPRSLQLSAQLIVGETTGSPPC